MIPTTRRISESLLRRCSVLCSTFQERIGVYSAQPLRGKKDDANSITSLFKPVPIKSNLDDINVGAELTGTLDKTTLLQVLNKFYQKEEIKALAVENGLDHEDKYNKSKTMEIGPAVPEFGDGCGEDLSLFSVLKAIDLYDKRRSAIAFAGINLQKTHYVCQKHFKPNQIIDNVTIRDISGKVLLQHQAFISFRRYCLETEALPVDLHVVISDILQGAGHIDDIFPYFIRHAKQTFPHIECLEDLRKISDLRTPANWYPLARAKTRKIIFHAGPTNSGKTHHALERFMTAKSGVYCGPLKLLATEVFHKSNSRGTACDLITGEERRLAQGDGNPSSHISCTIEMANISNPYEVAVIDEVQLIKDSGRGWAWTRALLGLPADEIHLCGEAATIDLVRSICTTTGEDVEVRRYKRLTPLEIEETALGSLDNVVAGDCIVCFSKSDIYSVSRAIEARGMEVAVIYGSLPPGTKLAQAAKFNDVASPCKVLIATDAIGMGLNLSIRRIIFYSLMRPTINEKGEKEIDVISVSSALQIAGRAGRYGTQWDKGFVTAFKQADLRKLSNLLSQEPEVITQAGLYPTADQIELYTYYLPNSTLSNLMDIFVSLSIVDDSLYFMCNIEDFKFLADMIQHVPLPLRARYTFCCAPVNKKLPFVCTMFLKFARQYSKNETLTFDWLCQNIGWPVAAPKTLIDLVHLEAVFDVLDLYLWFSYRFMDLLPDATVVRDTQKELDAVIQNGIIQLTRLLKNSETGVSSGTVSTQDEDHFVLKTQKNNYLRNSESVSSQVIGKGKLTERLLAQGLLTPNMLQELHKEWHKKNNHEDGSESPKTSRRKRKTK